MVLINTTKYIDFFFPSSLTQELRVTESTCLAVDLGYTEGKHYFTQYTIVIKSTDIAKKIKIV